MGRTLAWITSGLALSLGIAGCAADPADENDDDAVSADEAELRSSNAGASDELRIMSYNIKYGIAAGLDLSKIADAVLPSHPDLLALQEVDENTKRSGRLHETDELSALTKMPYRYFGKNFDYDGGGYGLAILSKYPLQNPRVIRLDDRTKKENGYEPRIALAADVDVRGTKVTFVSVHASLHEEEREGNAKAIVRALGSAASRAIVTGDFNEKPGKAFARVLGDSWMVDAFDERHPVARGYTIPAEKPEKRIDFIYRGRNFGRTTHAWVPEFEASDHRPVAATIPVRR